MLVVWVEHNGSRSACLRQAGRRFQSFMDGEGVEDDAAERKCELVLAAAAAEAPECTVKAVCSVCSAGQQPTANRAFERSVQRPSRAPGLQSQLQSRAGPSHLPYLQYCLYRT